MMASSPLNGSQGSVYTTPGSSIPFDLDAPACRRLISRTFLPNQVIPLIKAVFTSQDEVKAIGYLCGDDAQNFIDAVHETLDFPNLSSRLWEKCLNTLCRICGRRALLPSSLRIQLPYDRSHPPVCGGGFADVWVSERQGRKVAIKVLRVHLMCNFDKIKSRFCKEVVMWKTLRHPNVLPLLGAAMSDHQFEMISEWMVNGNVNEYVKAHRNVNPLELLEGVVRGLMYLHTDRAMTHGDLKGARILVNQHGNACLADFGFLTIVSDPTDPAASSSSVKGGTIRWMSPERIDPERFGSKDSRLTKESDCYSLGMVIYEVLSGQVPFASYEGFAVARKVTEGERPVRLGGAEGAWFTDDLWGMLTRCWEPRPKNRPSIKAVLECLGPVSKAWSPPSQADEDWKIGKDDRCLTPSSDISVLTPPAIPTHLPADPDATGEVTPSRSLADPSDQPSPSSLFTGPPPLGIPGDQVPPHDPTRVAGPSGIGPPPVPSFPAQDPAPQLPTSQAFIRGSVQVRHEFVHVHPTLYTLPVCLADIIDPATFPVSDSTTNELSMKFRFIALSRRLQLGIPLTFAKQHAVALGDLSNTIIHRFFIYYVTVYGCHLDQERRRSFDLIHVEGLLTQLCLEEVSTMLEEDDPFSFIQAYYFMANSCLYTHTPVPAKRYLKKAVDTAEKHGIRMVDRSFSNSSDSPNYSMIMDPPPEHLESVEERVATLAQMIFMPLQYRLLLGGEFPVSDYLVDQFRDELPHAYPRIWDEMPEVLRLRALQLIYETDRCIETYNLSLQCTRSWFSEYLVVVPQLTGLNDLIVRRATDAAALMDHVTYLTLRCCSIFVLTSLAQIYDIIARSPITLYESLKFRGICDETLRDVAKITVDFTKDDYSYLEPLLAICWGRALILVVVDEDSGGSPVSTSTRSSTSPDPENVPSLVQIFLDAKSNLGNTIRLMPSGLGVSVIHSTIPVKPIRHDPYTPDLLSEDIRLMLEL